MKKKDLLDVLQSDWKKERPDLDTRDMGIVGRIVLLGELLKKRASAVSSPFGIGYTDLDVLATLRRSGDPYTLRPAVLLELVLIQSGSLTACLDRLERKALVERVSTPNDRRGRAVRLTPAGIELTEKAIAVRFVDASESISALSQQERRQLEPLLRKLLVGCTANQDEEKQ